MITWRIGRSRFPADSASGNASRWNHKGVRVIYTASSLALSALEILASSAESLPEDYVSVAIEIPDDIAVTTFSSEDLPSNWWENPHPAETRDAGSTWASKRETAVLRVPSAVVRRERNYILNPAHPDFARIRFGQPEIFPWDDRFRLLLR